MKLSEYYQLVNQALQGDKEAQKKWGECQVEMIPKHIEFHSNKKVEKSSKKFKKVQKSSKKLKKVEKS